jgi:xanthine dehydrogenase YagS FAD-binding subunit
VSTALRPGAIAGGTDLLGILKDAVMPQSPELLLNLKTIANLDYIKEEGGVLKIGALTKLDTIASRDLVKTKYQALAEAASKVGSWQLRVMGTIGGNICQGVECWYYRYPNNQFNCLRKSTGGTCYALTGDHRYHSIFGASNGCIAVNPSDIAPALVAFGAKIVTSQRTLDAAAFFVPTGGNTTSLETGEIVTEIQIAAPAAQGVKSAFLKFALRKSIDFPMVNCAAVVTQANGKVSASSIVLGAVAGAPRRATEAEAYLKDQAIDETTAQAAGDEAVKAAVALSGNKYLVQIARTMVKRTVLACK